MNNQESRASVLCCLIALAMSSSLTAAQGIDDGSGEGRVLEELVVTGSFIKRTNQSDIASPLTSITTEDIESVGAFNPTDLVNTLTVNAGAQNENDGFNQTFSLGTTNINLRGLGVSSTLTLLNGRRQALTAATTLNGDQFTDLNSLIPSIAIGRVEILEDGASTLYGSDAVAGVVNFITRKDFVGAEAKLDYKTTSSDSQDDLQASFLFGSMIGNSTHIIGALSFFDRTPLSTAERRSDFELRDANSIFGAPGTFLVLNPGSAPTRVADPSCLGLAQTNPETTPGIVPPGNCGFDFGDYFRLVADEERLQSYVELNTGLASGTEFFVELGYSSNDAVSSGSPSQPILFPPFVPRSNPAFQDAALANVPGTGALFFGRVEGTGSASSLINIGSDTFRVATGFRGDLTANWFWESSLTYSENTYNYTNSSDTLVDRFNAAIVGRGGPDNNQFFNPIFGADNDPAVREDFRGTYAFEAVSELLTVNAFASGSIGDTGVAVGLQYRNTELSYDYNDAAENDNLFFFRGNDSFVDDRGAYALFLETDIPLSDVFSVQAAARYEDLDGFNTTDPKFGFLWGISDQLSIRGTLSSSFRVPSIFQTSGGLTAPARIFDPAVNGLATISQRTTGDTNNPIKPQESDTFNLGATWSTGDGDLTISLDYWKFDYTDFITPENATAVVAANPNGPQVTRVGGSPTGALVAVTTFFRNAGQLETDGLDLSIGKDFGGQFRFVADISKIVGYDLDDPVLGRVDGLGQRNFTNFGSPAPEMRANLGLLWTAENQSANVYWRYVDSYVDENNANARIDSFATVSAQYRYEFEAVPGADVLGLTVGVKNLFDELAPDVVSRTGFDPLTHSPLGRQVYVSLKGSF